MSRAARLAVLHLLVALATVATASARDTVKAARGIVTNIRGDAIMINLPEDIDLTFRVDTDTNVVARGAGTKMRRAQAEGAPGVRLADVVPIGASVEVRYVERDGQRYARRIVSAASAGR